MDHQVAIRCHYLACHDRPSIATGERTGLMAHLPAQVLISQQELQFLCQGLRPLAAAEKALEYKTGARGLRTIIEQVLLDSMYEIPSLRNVRRCEITREVIKGDVEPELTYWSETA